MGWEPNETGGWSRRKWVQVVAGAAAIGAASAVGALALRSLLGSPAEVRGGIRAAFHYTRYGGTDVWWKDHEDQPMKVTDFQEWQGATGIWLGLFREGRPVSGTGYPVLAIRVKRDDSVFQATADPSFPQGFRLYYDDPVRDIRIVAFLDRCVHLCCLPTWHVSPVPSAFRDYVVEPRTSLVNPPQDPIWCLCHNSMYDPMALVEDKSPQGTTYIGARRVHLPASRALPVVPVKAEADVLVGGMIYPEWYSFCL